MGSPSGNKIYNTLDEIQTDPDLWLEEYKNQRTYSGKYYFGRNLIQEFLETVPLAQQKMLQNLPHAAQNH